MIIDAFMKMDDLSWEAVFSSLFFLVPIGIVVFVVVRTGRRGARKEAGP